MNCKDFNTCMEELKQLEHILIDSGKVNVLELLTHDKDLYLKHNELMTELDQENYLADTHYYIMTKMDELGIEYHSYGYKNEKKI